MPYSSPHYIPDRIRTILPPHAQRIFHSAFNNAWQRYTEQTSEKREETSFRVAWNAVKRVYEKNTQGEWVPKDVRKKRSAQEVLKSHLDLRKQGKTEEDIEQNYDKKCIILSSYGVFRRHSGVKKSARLLSKHIPDAEFTFQNILCDEETALLEWTARSKTTTASIKDGADSFVIRNGLIVAQTIHYSVKK